MSHLYVICGHGRGDSGAVGGGYNEAERVRTLGRRIKELGGENVTLHDTNDNAYASDAISHLGIPKDWQIVELHMDSGPSSARGGHVIIKAGFRADKYDSELARLISGIFPGRSQSVVGRGDLANPNRAARRGYGYRLVENGFISNDKDRAIFNASIDQLARGYLAAFGISASSAPSEPEAGASGLGDTSWTGPLMWRELESQLGLTPTGTISGQSDYNRTKVQVRIERGLYDCGYTRHGSTCVRALQGKLGVEVDGQMGPGTVKALQAWLNDKVGAGLAVDGYYGPATSRAVGRALEAGLFRG